MEDDPIYKEKMCRKLQIYINHCFPLIEIKPPDLKNLDFFVYKILNKK